MFKYLLLQKQGFEEFLYEKEYRSFFRDIDRWLWFTSHRTKLLDKWQFRLAAWHCILTNKFFIFLPITYGYPRTFLTPLVRIPVLLCYDGFFPWLGKRVLQREKRVKRAQSRPTKGRIQFREKSTIRLAKTRYVISLHVSTRSSVIDRFESPSKVAPLFRGTYFLALPSPFFIHYRAFISIHTPTFTQTYL